jgi:hypothetical protein
MEKELDAKLKSFLSERGLNYEWQTGEHAGCWGKGCSHLVNELNIWYGDNRKFSWTFEEGCKPDMIIETMTSRLEEPWIKSKIAA